MYSAVGLIYHAENPKKNPKPCHLQIRLLQGIDFNS